MSALNRRDNPARSSGDAAAASRHRNYRFKSYLEANTQERARFESMQDLVPDRIAEVIASFREEKLTVQPHRAQMSIAIPDAIETTPRARPLPTAVSAPLPRGTTRSAWPWYLAALALALSLMIWFDTGADPSPVVPESRSSGALLTQPGYEPRHEPERDMPAAAGARPEVQVQVVQEPAAVPAAPAEQLVAPTEKPVKRVAKPVRPVEKADEAMHYSEDLTGLLQGQ